MNSHVNSDWRNLTMDLVLPDADETLFGAAAIDDDDVPTVRLPALVLQRASELTMFCDAAVNAELRTADILASRCALPADVPSEARANVKTANELLSVRAHVATLGWNAEETRE